MLLQSAKKGKEGILDAMGRKASGPAGSVTFSNLQRQYAQQLASRHAKAYAAVGNRPLQVNDAGAIGQAKAEQQRQEPKHQDGKGEGEGQNPEKGDEQAEQVHGVTKSQQQGPDDQRRPNETISAAVAKENLVTGLPTDPPKVPRDSPVGEVAQGFRASVVKTNLSEMELFQGYLSRNRLGKV